MSQLSLSRLQLNNGSGVTARPRQHSWQRPIKNSKLALNQPAAVTAGSSTESLSPSAYYVATVPGPHVTVMPYPPGCSTSKLLCQFKDTSNYLPDVLDNQLVPIKVGLNCVFPYCPGSRRPTVSEQGDLDQAQNLTDVAVDAGESDIRQCLPYGILTSPPHRLRPLQQANHLPQ